MEKFERSDSQWYHLPCTQYKKTNDTVNNRKKCWVYRILKILPHGCCACRHSKFIKFRNEYIFCSYDLSTPWYEWSISFLLTKNFFFTHLFSFRSFQKFCCNMTGPKFNVILLRYRATSFVLVANSASYTW